MPMAIPCITPSPPSCQVRLPQRVAKGMVCGVDFASPKQQPKIACKVVYFNDNQRIWPFRSQNAFHLLLSQAGEWALICLPLRCNRLVMQSQHQASMVGVCLYLYFSWSCSLWRKVHFKTARFASHLNPTQLHTSMIMISQAGLGVTNLDALELTWWLEPCHDVCLHDFFFFGSFFFVLLCWDILLYTYRDVYQHIWLAQFPGSVVI